MQFVPPLLDSGHATPPRVQTRSLHYPADSQSDLTSAASPVALAQIATEYAALRNQGHCPLGMYVMPSAESLLFWDGLFFCHQGYYNGACLKFRVTFPINYPQMPPQVHFITDVFHPLVSPRDGRFSLAFRFRPWRPEQHRVFDLLHWIKTAFKKESLDQFQENDCWNKEAYRLYQESTASQFAALAAQSATLSQSNTALFDKDRRSKASFSMPFTDVKSDKLATLRAQFGLRDWAKEAEKSEVSS